MLRGLLNEPSGMIGNLLARLDTAPEEVRAQLDMAGEPARAARRIGRDEVAASRTVFIPAAAEQIWDFLIRPENLPAWDESLTELEAESVTDPRSLVPGDTPGAPRRSSPQRSLPRSNRWSACRLTPPPPRSASGSAERSAEGHWAAFI